MALAQPMPGSSAKTGETSRPVRRHSGKRMRLRGLLLLLVVSGAVFIWVVCWHRDLARVKSATDAAETARIWIENYLADRGHLPFELDREVARALTSPEVPYPDRSDIYRLADISKPIVLVSGPRQGLLPPREAGCAVIILEQGKLRTEWWPWERAEAAREERDALLRPGAEIHARP